MSEYRIAISGKANSGKSSLSFYLQESLKDLVGDFYFKNFAFADSLKKEIEKEYPQWEWNGLYGESHYRETLIPGTSITYRQALLKRGSEGRSKDPNYWINRFVEDFNKTVSLNFVYSNKLYIVSDCRFINELQALKKLGFKTIRIKRKYYRPIDDVSETEQDLIPDEEFDTICENEGTIKNLEQWAKNYLEILKG